MRIESGKRTQGKVGGWLHSLTRGEGDSLATSAAPQSASRQKLAPLDRRDRVYRRLLSLCRLSGKHRQDLLARGCSSEEITVASYATLPLQGRARICKQIREGNVLSLDGVPGFYLGNGERRAYWTLAGSPGLLIPCHAPDGRIRGLRIRPDDTGGAGKYRWLSSAKRSGGVGSGVHCHIARPAVVQDSRVWIVEGEIKANISAPRLGAVVVSIPGVDTWTQALPDLAELLPDCGRVVVALDSDWRDKLAVHQAAWNLVMALETLGYNTEVALWACTTKGLDDLLVSKGFPELHPASALPEPTWPAKVSSRRMADAPERKLTVLPILEARQALAWAFQMGLATTPTPCA
jgi:hypothetical protein